MGQAEFSQRVMAIEGRRYRVSPRILGREADSRRAAREALCRAWLSQYTLKDISKFKSWLIGLLVAACRTRLGRRRQALSYALATPSGGDIDLAAREASFALDEKLRLPLVLNQVEGCGFTVSTQLDKPVFYLTLFAAPAFTPVQNRKIAVK